jgi:hypothetical protein
VWAVLRSLFADPFKKNRFLASEFIVADRFPKFTGKKCCLFLGFEYYYGYPSVRHFFEKSFFHCLESIFEREPLVAIAKNFAGNNATGVVSSATHREIRWSY